MTLEEFLQEWNNDSERVLVHTSGSTGKPKPIWVEKRRMEASARITCDFLGLKEGDTALLNQPLHVFPVDNADVGWLQQGCFPFLLRTDGHGIGQHFQVIPFLNFGRPGIPRYP